MGTRTFVAGIGVGAGLMYLFDPTHGELRRQRLAARAHEAWSELEGVVDDESLVVERGEAESAGESAREMVGASASLEAAIATRRADDIAGLELVQQRRRGAGAGGAERHATLVGVLGGALAAYGLLRRGLPGRVLRLAGVGLLAHGLRATEDASRRGGERRRALDIQRSLEVAAPTEQVFAFFTNPTAFARFLDHVREVRDLGGGRARWRADGPAGEVLQWTTALTELVPNHLVAWRSEPGGDLAQSGIVRLTPTSAGTRIDLRLCYGPAAGAGRDAGQRAAELFGADPRRQLEEDLARLRALVEAGRGAVPAHGGLA